MDPTKTEGKARRLFLLLAVAGLILSGLLLAACGSSSSSSSSQAASTESEAEGGSGTTATEEGETSGGDPETTVYVEGVPTLKELYESSNEEPPSTGPAAAKGKTVAFVTCGMQPVGCAVPAESFLEASKALGWNTRVYDGKLNTNNAYATVMHAAIASKPDALVLYGIGCEEVKTPLEEAKAAGIPVVEAITPDCNVAESGGPELFTVENQFSKKALNAPEFYERFGENQAAYVIDKTEGKAKVITTEWLGGTGPNVGNGYKKMFEKCPECEVLENIEWEAAEQSPGGPLEQRFKTALTKFPEANAAIISYDSMAAYGGLAKAVVDSGSDLLSVAGEGFAETVSLMEEEKGIDAEGGAWDNKWAGWELADQLNRYFNGQPSVPQGVGLDVVNLEHNLPPKGQNYAADVDYVKAYEEIWAGKKEGK